MKPITTTKMIQMRAIDTKAEGSGIFKSTDFEDYSESFDCGNFLEGSNSEDFTECSNSEDYIECSSNYK